MLKYFLPLNTETIG